MSRNGAKLGNHDAAARRALKQTLRELHLSAKNGRTMTLPNLLRLYRRRTVGISPTLVHSGLRRLRALYMRFQPFQGK